MEGDILVPEKILSCDKGKHVSFKGGFKGQEGFKGHMNQTMVRHNVIGVFTILLDTDNHSIRFLILSITDDNG